MHRCKKGPNLEEKSEAESFGTTPMIDLCCPALKESNSRHTLSRATEREVAAFKCYNMWPTCTTAKLEPGIDAHQDALTDLPTSRSWTLNETKGIVQETNDHSLPFSGDFDRCRSIVGRSFVVGGDDAADGGDAAWLVDSPSRAASALKHVNVRLDVLYQVRESSPKGIRVGLISIFLLILLPLWRSASPTAGSAIFATAQHRPGPQTSSATISAATAEKATRS